jgi:hypothetical protein
MSVAPCYNNRVITTAETVQVTPATVLDQDMPHYIVFQLRFEFAFIQLCTHNVCIPYNTCRSHRWLLAGLGVRQLPLQGFARASKRPVRLIEWVKLAPTTCERHT